MTDDQTRPSIDEVAERLTAIKRHWIEAKAESGFGYWPHRHAQDDIEFLLSQLEASRWRPISEYPREHDPAPETYWGPNVLLFVPTGSIAPASDYRIVTGRLEADMWLCWGDGGAMYDIEGRPSHFMPLPAPPATASEGSEGA